jgi:hypothetical protein
MKKAVITLVTRGKLAGQFRFVLKAKNGEIVASSYPETYKSKKMAEKTLKAHFAEFQIVG